jgi:DNA-directed RNA polymerase II subunit RPB1
MSNIPISEIRTITYSLETNKSNQSASHMGITKKVLFDNNNVPDYHGLYSLALGTTDSKLQCMTCLQPKAKCLGHAGHLTLHYPIPAPLMFLNIKKILSIVCFKCGDLVIDKSKIGKLPPKTRFHKAYQMSISKHAKGDIKSFKKKCPNPDCDAMHPVITKHPTSPYFLQTQAIGENGAFEGLPQTLFYHTIDMILRRITDENVELLGIELTSHPKNFILKVIKIPTVNMRPNVKQSGSTKGTNDSLTSTLQRIMEFNEKLRVCTTDEAITENFKHIEDLIDRYFSLIKGTTKKEGAHGGNDKSISDRIKGKKELIRSGLLGKRTRGTGRAVIANNPNIKPGQVSLSLKFVRILQCEETVQDYNIEILQRFFKNGTKQYPGCTQIIKKSTGRTHMADSADLFLEPGDVILRDLVTGDFVNINRQPSLQASSITAMEIVVSEDQGEYIMGLNVIACPLFGADFDGDQMNVIVNSKVYSRYEISRLASIENWFINIADSSPKLGQNYDSIIGLFLLSFTGVKLNRSSAMRIFSRCSIKPDFSEDRLYTGRELISMTMAATPISMTHGTNYHMKALEPYLNYDAEDIRVEIRNGVLVRGVLDKKTIDGGAVGGLYHTIAIEYGNAEALRVIYDMQQIAIEYVQLCGVSIGIKDVLLNEDANREIMAISSAIMDKSAILTDKLSRGQIVPPLGQSVNEFYEIQQTEFLRATDAFDEPIMKAIDVKANNLLKLVLSGSKGKIEQFRNITAIGGQKTINSERTTLNYGWQRTAPFHTRYVTDPVGRGYIANSYINGLTSAEAITGFINARYDFITIALMTAKTGYQNRKSVKNLESIISNNYLWSVKGHMVLQFGYSEDMCDVRKIHTVKIASVMMDNAQLAAEFETKEFAAEFAAIVRDRDEYRAVFLDIEDANYTYMMKAERLLPFDVEKVIISTATGKMQKPKSLGGMVKRVAEFVELLPYCLINDRQAELRGFVSPFIRNAVWFPSMLIRYGLCAKRLLKHGIDEARLETILSLIKHKYIGALISPGAAVGIIGAQAFSEPLTQYMLDAKHSSATGGTTKSAMLKIEELLGARPVKNLKDPRMTLQVLAKHRANKSKVQEIANTVEAMFLSRFVSDWQIFYERFGEVVHSKYENENETIRKFASFNPGIVTPNLLRWCIRFSLDKMEMILKNISIEFIVGALRRVYGASIYVVYTTDNAPKMFMRVYMASGWSKDVPDVENIKRFKDGLLNQLVRGVEGITSARVIPLIKNEIDKLGALSPIGGAWCIETKGTNLIGVLPLPDLETSAIVTDAIQEIAEVFGIEAARNQIMYQMKSIVDKCGFKHLTIYADEMTFNGNVTSIERAGMKKRDTASVFLRMGYDSPLEALRKAMFNKTENVIDGITAKLLIGGIPNYGTLYNNYVINEDVVRENVQSVDDFINDL